MAKKKPDSKEEKDKNTEGQSIEPKNDINLPQGLENILATLEPHVKEQILQSIRVVVTRSTSFGGALLLPQHLEGYNQVVPGGAERIFRMVENQSEERMALEKHSVNEELKQRGRGQVFGFILGLFGIASAVYLAVNGHDTVAGIFGTTTIVGLVAVFVIGRKQQQENRG